MKLEIDINEKEFGIDIEDKFQDFFKRLRAEIQSRLISNDTLVCGVYELETVEMFLTAFKNATIEQEPKTGKWIEVEDYNGDVHYQCDQCGNEFTLIDGTPKDNNYNYCPNCGSYNGGKNEI